MLTYHDIHYLDSTFLIEETIQYVMNGDGRNILANDLQVTLIIKDYNQNATSRLDVDLIITDLEGSNRPPTTEEENDICVVCFRNYKDGNNLCSLTFGHNFHFACIDQWLRTKKVVWYKGVGRVDGELGKATSQLDQLVYEFIQLV
ncbi:hypothetical protein F2Q68_00031675 [Brassica cretica]|uniref:RING-type E3 ubiquitin transferase n=1 Tax=Brassica cretica TaxID=69181 RepID=A0A8S9GCE8_BRACR|nr:hypothetical protein F2Q68_00031675 [Brassica cretica]